MALTVSQLAPIKDKDPYLYESLVRIVNEVNVMQRQTGVAPTGNLPVPQAIGNINVTAANGYFSIAITDKSVVQRGIEYFAEYDTLSGFTNAQVIHMGVTRNMIVNLGNLTLYWRAYSQYIGSDIPSPLVTFGTPPTAVAGGGSAPPALQKSQGSGTSQTPGAGFGRNTGRVGNPRATL
jgi:hypothetical protein